MSDVVSRLAAEDESNSDRDDTWAGTATVTNINAGTTPDGRRLIGITWRGTPLTATYVETYTPVLNRRVVFLKDGTSLFVLGGPALA